MAAEEEKGGGGQVRGDGGRPCPGTHPCGPSSLVTCDGHATHHGHCCERPPWATLSFRRFQRRWPCGAPTSTHQLAGLAVGKPPSTAVGVPPTVGRSSTAVDSTSTASSQPTNTMVLQCKTCGPPPPPCEANDKVPKCPNTKCSLDKPFAGPGGGGGTAPYSGAGGGGGYLLKLSTRRGKT